MGYVWWVHTLLVSCAGLMPFRACWWWWWAETVIQGHVHALGSLPEQNGQEVWPGGRGDQWCLDGVGLGCFWKDLVPWAWPPLLFQHFHSIWVPASPLRRLRGKVNWFCAAWSCIVNAINRKFTVNGACFARQPQLWRWRLSRISKDF